MIHALINFVKDAITVMLIIVTAIVFLLALPAIIEQATSDDQEQPYSGACPDYSYHNESM